MSLESPAPSGSTDALPRPHRSAFAALALLLAACGAGWHRIPVAPPGLDPEQQVQVFRGSAVAQLHAITINADSLTGIPFHRPVDCDSCRVSFPLASVDSVRAGNPEAGFLKTSALVFAVTLAVLFTAFGGFPTGPGS